MSGIRTNVDGSVDIIAGAKVLSLKTTGEVIKEQQRVTFAIVAGVAEVAVPSWATRITILADNVLPPAGVGAVILRGFDSALITSGYNGTLGYTTSTSTGTSVGLVSTYVPLSQTGVNNTFVVDSIIELVKTGSVWRVRGVGRLSVAAEAILTFLSRFSVNASGLTKLQLSHSGGNLTSGTFEAIFE